MINYLEKENYAMNQFQYLRYGCSRFPGKKEKNPNKFFYLGKLRPRGNINAWIEEDNCSERVVRRLTGSEYHMTVIRDDGTVWTINLDCFEDVTPLNVYVQNR